MYKKFEGWGGQGVGGIWMREKLCHKCSENSGTLYIEVVSLEVGF